MNKRAAKRVRNLLFTSGVVFLIAALSLAAFNYWESQAAGKTSRVAAEKLREKIVSVRDTAYPAADGGMFSVSVEGEKYVGIICIPSLGIELPVRAEWSEERLKTAPCLYSGSVSGGDMVIAGHNYASHFGGIGGLSVGESVFFLSANGFNIEYNVDCVEALSPYQVYDMKHGDWALTLFTCSGSGGSRIAVRCLPADAAQLLRGE